MLTKSNGMIDNQRLPKLSLSQWSLQEEFEAFVLIWVYQIFIVRCYLKLAVQKSITVWNKRALDLFSFQMLSFHRQSLRRCLLVSRYTGCITSLALGCRKKALIKCITFILLKKPEIIKYVTQIYSVNVPSPCYNIVWVYDFDKYFISWNLLFS